jgi:hypothetical protein
LARFRISIFVGACLLAAYGAWLLTSESLSPRVGGFAQVMAAPASEQVRQSAAMAAQVGLIRGDLWAGDAFALASGLGDSPAKEDVQSATAALPLARTTAERGARLAPHDARLWLLIAALDAQTDPRDRRIAGTLKMSYYTAPNDAMLMPLRLAVATDTEAIQDPDLQSLVAIEIRTLLGRRADLTPAIAAAYRRASATGRSYIESVLRDADSGLLARIQVGPARP